MSIPEQFLMDNPNIVDQPFNVFKAYNFWLKKQYRECPGKAGKEALDKESQRFSDIYNRLLRELLLGK